MFGPYFGIFDGDFRQALKEKLAASDDAKETQISAIEFPAKTWTTWGANHPDTIEVRFNSILIRI